MQKDPSEESKRYQKGRDKAKKKKAANGMLPAHTDKRPPGIRGPTFQLAETVILTRMSRRPAPKGKSVTPRALGLFSWQNFWQNATVAVSLLFGKYCPIIV
jgi:hypothetical protein